MNLIKKISEAIKDEYKGSKEYHDLSRKMKKKNIDFAIILNKMATDENNHAEHLIKMYDELRFGEHKKRKIIKKLLRKVI